MASISTTESALESLLHSPRLPEYAERIERWLADERSRRARFYEEMDDGQKVEFIARFSMRKQTDRRWPGL